MLSSNEALKELIKNNYIYRCLFFLYFSSFEANNSTQHVLTVIVHNDKVSNIHLSIKM